MKQKRTTQDDRVLAYMQSHGGITQKIAINEFGAYRLSAIIHKLRHKRGLNIVSENMTEKNRYGDSRTFANYKLAGEKVYGKEKENV